MVVVVVNDGWDFGGLFGNKHILLFSHQSLISHHLSLSLSLSLSLFIPPT